MREEYFASIPVGYESASFVLDGKVYFGTGKTIKSPITYLQDFYVYDPIAHTVTKIAPYPGSGREYAVAFTVGGKGYVGLGWDGTASLQDMYAYDPASNSWSKIANFPSNNSATASGFNANGVGYVMEGSNSIYNFPSSKILYQYSPDVDKWTPVNAYPGTARSEATFTSTTETVTYGGFGMSGGNSSLLDFYAYDAAANTWTSKASPAFGEGIIRWSDALSLTKDSKIYIADVSFYRNGTSENPLRKYFMEYSPEADSWKQLADLPTFNNEYYPFVIATDQDILAGYIYIPTNMLFIYRYESKIPNQPSSFTINQDKVNKDTFILNWKDNSDNELGFIITDPSGNVDTASANATTYTKQWAKHYDFGGLEKQFKIRAYNASGNSTESTKSVFIPHLAPTDLQLSPTSNELVVQWQHPALTYFSLQIATKVDFSDTLWAGNLTKSNSSYSFSLKELQENTPYFVRLRTEAANSWSEYIYGDTLTSLYAPAELSAVPNAHGISLSWSDSSKYETTYLIERWDQLSGTYSEIIRLAENAETFTDSTVQENEQYQYRVMAISEGNQSAFAETNLVYAKLHPVTQLRFDQVVGNQLTLHWKNLSLLATDIHLTRIKGENETSETFTLSAEDSTFTDKNLEENTRYTYKAMNRMYYSGYYKESPIITVDTITYLNAPSEVTSTGNAISWLNSSEQATQIVVESTTDLSIAFQPIDTLEANATSYTSLTPDASQNIYFRLKAISADNKSQYSETVVVSEPRTLSLEYLGADSVSLSFSSTKNTQNLAVVERALELDGIFHPLDTLKQEVLSYTDLTVEESTNYLYRLITLAAGTAKQSSEQVAGHTLLKRPDNLMVDSARWNYVALSWQDNSAMEDGYTIERLNPETNTYVEITFVNKNNTSAEIYERLENGIYTFRVRAINSNTTSLYSNEVEINPVLSGLEEETIEAGYRIYPNPTRGAFMLKASQAYERIEILNASGKLVQTYAPAENGQYAIDSLKPGLYLLRIIEKDKIYLQRFIKQ